MTTSESHSIASRYRRASAYSSLNPCEVRSPEQTTTSGLRSLISTIARSKRSGRKNCCPQWRSLSCAIVKFTAQNLEDPAHRVEEQRCDSRGTRDRQEPAGDDRPRDPPADRREPTRRPRSHHRTRNGV